MPVTLTVVGVSIQDVRDQLAAMWPMERKSVGRGLDALIPTDAGKILANMPRAEPQVQAVQADITTEDLDRVLAAERQQSGGGANNATVETSIGATGPVPPKRTRRTKAQIAADEAAARAGVTPAVPDQSYTDGNLDSADESTDDDDILGLGNSGDASPVQPPVTLDDLRAAGAEVMAKPDGIAIVGAILGRFTGGDGQPVKKLAQLPEASWGACLAALRGAV